MPTLPVNRSIQTSPLLGTEVARQPGAPAQVQAADPRIRSATAEAEVFDDPPPRPSQTELMLPEPDEVFYAPPPSPSATDLAQQRVEEAIANRNRQTE